MDFPLIAAFIIGLFSTLHCLGMCGGIMGALTLSLAPEVRTQRHRLLPFLIAYNSGRILSYALAGALLGTLGSGLYAVISPRLGHWVLQILAAVLLTGVGLYLAGWFPRFAMLERVGLPLWRRLEPYGRRLLPVRSPFQALLYGTIWGWLPCGLVYTTLLWTLTAGGPVEGALFMAAFGAGTLPTVLAAGMLAQWVTRLRRQVYIRKAAGVLLIAMAITGLLFADQLAHLQERMTGQEQLQCTQ